MSFQTADRKIILDFSVRRRQLGKFCFQSCFLFCTSFRLRLLCFNQQKLIFDRRELSLDYLRREMFSVYLRYIGGCNACRKWGYDGDFTLLVVVVVVVVVGGRGKGERSAYWSWAVEVDAWLFDVKSLQNETGFWRSETSLNIQFWSICTNTKWASSLTVRRFPKEKCWRKSKQRKRRRTIHKALR